MIKAEEVAVCFSGLARADHEWVIERTKNILPYDTFFSTWEGYDIPKNATGCELFPEPTYDYHNLVETKTKPDCSLWRKYTRTPTQGNRGGKIWWKKNLLAQTKSNSKQILGHSFLVNTLPEKYKVIIRMRYDAILSSKADYSKYIQHVQDTGHSVGFDALGGFNEGPSHVLKEHKNLDCRRCTGWYLWDHVLFHSRHRLKNVQEYHTNKDLLGAEWGWYQILHHQWGDKDFINVEGGETLVRCCTSPRETWDQF